MRRSLPWTLVLCAVLAGCGDDDPSGMGVGDGGTDGSSGGDGGGGGGADGGVALGTTFKLSGMVTDFVSGQAVPGQATVNTSGLIPAPTVSVTGASYQISGIAPFSVFHVLAGAAPTHRSTYNMASTVDAADVTGVVSRALAETTLTAYQTAFAVTPMAGRGILIARTVDMTGSARAGIAATAFQLGGQAPPHTPLFLDTARAAAPAATSTTASGYVVFYDVMPGLVTVNATTASGFTFSGPQAPVAAGTVSLVDLVVTAGAVQPPTNVSFSTQVFPIFTRRGCETCHSGNGIGRDLGGLTLNGSTTLVFRELTQELSPNYNITRVNKAMPEMSKLLTMPSFEQPADRHPNVTFASASDRDYQLILAWIKEGAKDN